MGETSQQDHPQEHPPETSPPETSQQDHPQEHPLETSQQEHQQLEEPSQQEHPQETSQQVKISRQKEIIQTIGNRQLLHITTTAPDPTTLPPSQCIDEGCSSEHDGWGECVDFSKDVDWQRLTTEFDLSAGHVPGKCGNARVAVEECCKCMKARIHHTTTTTQAPTKPWYHYQNWGKK